MSFSCFFFTEEITSFRLLLLWTFINISQVQAATVCNATFTLVENAETAEIRKLCSHTIGRQLLILLVLENIIVIRSFHYASNFQIY